ncbi:MAG TPA: LCP family protein [Candidatus Nanopelagicales bacterium]|nr:LCP family protein [Candidatus Nanopelagicales bacterium]
MSERPPGKGGPEEGTPEYNWLYGGRGQASSDDDATRVVPKQGSPTPDHTRAMPAVPRTSTSGGGRPPGGPGRTATSAPPPRPARSRRLPRFRAGWIKYLVLLWLVFMIAVPFWAWSKVTKIDAMPDGNRPDDQPGTTYLLVGSDSRDDLTAEERKDLGTGGPVGQRTDTIMLLHTGDGPNLLMSIPRDSIVSIPGHGDAEKVNAAYAFGGPKLLIRTLEDETGIRIDDYVEIGFGGFVGMVDAVGGVEICPTTAMKDPLANLDIEKGCQEADGKTALGYARSRHTSNIGDIDRAKHQREVVSAIGKEGLSPWTFLNPVRYYRLNMAGADSFSVSEGTSPLALGRFAFAMTRVNGEDGLTCGVPIRDLAVTWDEERANQLFKHIIEDDTAGIPNQLCTPTGMPK